MAENPMHASTVVFDDSGSSSPRFSCKLGAQKMVIFDKEQRFQEGSYPESDSFVVDFGILSHFHGADEDTNSSSSKITVKMPSSLSRKGSQIDVADGSSTGKNTATSLAGACNAEKYIISSSIPVETKEPVTAQPQAHQIKITGESKYRRLYSRQRSYSARLINPGRVLFFFATLSSMGTILLIYFTLSIGRLNGDGSSNAQV